MPWVWRKWRCPGPESPISHRHSWWRWVYLDKQEESDSVNHWMRTDVASDTASAFMFSCIWTKPDHWTTSLCHMSCHMLHVCTERETQFLADWLMTHSIAALSPKYHPCELHSSQHKARLWYFYRTDYSLTIADASLTQGCWGCNQDEQITEDVQRQYYNPTTCFCMSPYIGNTKALFFFKNLVFKLLNNKEYLYLQIHCISCDSFIINATVECF